MANYNKKELMRTYKKNAYNVNVYESKMTKKERAVKNSQIKNDILLITRIKII